MKKKAIMWVSIAAAVLVVAALAISIAYYLRSGDSAEEPDASAGEQQTHDEHDFSTVEVIRQADCTQDGITARKCSCGKEELEIIPAAGHSFGQWQTDRAPTCTSSGAKSMTCVVCQAVQTEPLARLNHQYEEVELQEESDTAHYTCTICGDAFAIPAEQETDLYNARYYSDCDKNYSFEIYCPQGEAYIRQHLYIADAYYHNTEQQANLRYNLSGGNNGRWTVSPVTPYTPGNIYIASRSGEVLFGDMTVRDMTFRICREESKEFAVSEDVLFLQKMENENPGYYPYTLEYSETAEMYWLSVQKTNGMNVGDIICVGDATCMDDVIRQSGEPDVFGKIEYIYYDEIQQRCYLELSAPKLTELFSTLNIYSDDAVLRENLEFVSSEQLTKQATQLLYQSDDFAKLICAVQDTSVTYLAARGYTTTLSTIGDFFKSIQIKKEESQIPEVQDDGVIRGKIVVGGELPIPITLSEDPDSEQLGQIKFYFKATISLDSLQIVLSLDNQTVAIDGNEKRVKAQIGSKQQITVGFEMGVEMQMDWTLSSKPYAYNHKTGTYHYATCKHLAYVSDSSNIEKLTAESFFEKLADESILVENECKTCRPVSCMLTDNLVINTESKVIHTPSCTHAKKLKAPTAEISELPLGNLLTSGSGYQECQDCKPSNRTGNSFSEQVLQKMKSGELVDNLDTFKAMAKEAGDSPGASTLEIASLPFTITGLDVIELQLGIYFDFHLEATLEYNNEVQINSEFGIYLNNDGFIPYSDSRVNQNKNDVTLTGKTRVDVGLQVGIDIHLTGLEKYCYAQMNARAGLYAELHGAVQYDFIRDRSNYASAYFEAGVHLDLVGDARLIFVKTGEKSFVPEEYQNIPFLRYGFEKLYYNFDKLPDEILVDTIYYNLENANLLNVKYYDIVEMKEGKDQLNIMGIKGKYTVEFQLKNGTNCTVADGYLLVTTPNESFTDELTVIVNGNDRWGKYRTGNTQYNLESFTIPVRYDAANVNPEQGAIPSGVVEHNGHYYQLFDAGVSWENAQHACSQKGGYLATITTAEEQAFVLSLMEDAKLNMYWLGCVRNPEWEWVTGEEFSFSNWGDEEPNNEMGEEAYIQMYAKSFRKKSPGDWNDASNMGAEYSADFYRLENTGYICEWDNYEFIPEHSANMTLEGRMDALVGYYQGWYTASQGITGGSIGVHRTNDLLQDEAALQMYATRATDCARDEQGNITTQYTVEDIREIVERHTEEYIAIYMFGPLRENPTVEDGLYTMTVTYNENSGTYEMTGSEWIQHDTYVFADVKNARLEGNNLISDVYGPVGFLGSYDKGGELSLVRYIPSFEETE